MPAARMDHLQGSFQALPEKRRSLSVQKETVNRSINQVFLHCRYDLRISWKHCSQPGGIPFQTYNATKIKALNTSPHSSSVLAFHQFQNEHVNTSQHAANRQKMQEIQMKSLCLDNLTLQPKTV